MSEIRVIKDSMFKLLFEKDENCRELIKCTLGEEYSNLDFQRLTLTTLLAYDRVNDLGLLVGIKFYC